MRSEVGMEWVRGGVVGRGSFGTVHLAAMAGPQGDPEDGRRRNPLVMAVKSSLLAESATLLREKEVLRCLAGCPEVVACYGDDVTLEADGRRLYNVFLEYVPGGALSEVCRRTPLPEEEVRRYTASILRGLRRVHEAGYVHCDVKPQNVLVAGKGRAKIADFGLAKRAGEKVEAAAAAGDRGGAFLRGTPLYMAPESVVRGEHEPPSDVWSLGCLVAEMATGEPAWRCADAAALVFRIASGREIPEIPKTMSEEGKDFLRRCLLRDPSERWTAAMLLDHPFVAGAGDDDDSSGSPGDKSPESDTPGPSPRSIFGFPTWASSSPLPSLCSTPTPSQESYSPDDSHLGPAKHLRHLTTGSPEPDWTSPSCCWITVREGSLAGQAEPAQEDPPLVLLQRMIDEEKKNGGRLHTGEPAAAGTSWAAAVEPVLLTPRASNSQELQLRPPPVSSDDWISEGEGNFRRSRGSEDHGSPLSPSSARQPWRHQGCSHSDEQGRP